MTNANRHIVEFYRVKAAAEFEARMAAEQAERKVQFEAAIVSPAFAYARARMICGSYTLFVYVNDAKSPTGVTLAGTSDDFEGGVALLDAAGRAFPYSPTEALQSSGARL